MWYNFVSYYIYIYIYCDDTIPISSFHWVFPKKKKKDYEKNFTKIRFACQSDFQEIYIYIYNIYGFKLFIIEY